MTLVSIEFNFQVSFIVMMWISVIRPRPDTAAKCCRQTEGGVVVNLWEETSLYCSSATTGGGRLRKNQEPDNCYYTHTLSAEWCAATHSGVPVSGREKKKKENDQRIIRYNKNRSSCREFSSDREPRDSRTC